MTIDLYYGAASSPCPSVLLTTKLLGVDLNLKPLNLKNKEQLAPESVKYPMFLGNASPDAAKYAKMEEVVKLLDIFLEGHEVVVGNNLTITDIPLVTTITTYDVIKFDLSPYKNVTRWYAKMKGVEISDKQMLAKIRYPFLHNEIVTVHGLE